MRVFVTGARSFTGAHLRPVLEADPRVTWVGGTDLPGDISTKFPFWACDIRDRSGLENCVRDARPDAIVHLAGIARGDEETCFAVNLDGTRNLVAASARLGSPAPVLVLSSAAAYGLTLPQETPVVETVPFRPVTAYGASKAAAETAALAAHRRGETPVIVARPFNLVGPGLPPGFAATDFLAAARLAVAQGRSEILVGNLEAKRDFLDVRDAVRAYADLVLRSDAQGRVFNVASGHATAVSRILELVLDAVGTEVTPRIDPARLRASEVAEQAGSIEAIRTFCGWEPSIDLPRSIVDLVAAG